jgi:predicted acetyltransferase
MKPTLVLRRLAASDEVAFRTACREMEPDGFEFGIGFRPGGDFVEFCSRLEREEAGVGLAPDLVPSTFLVADVEGEIVGRVSIRHSLNDRLRAVGGHIGYGVRPGHRRKGYATEILRQSLHVASRLGITRVLLTTDASNDGSQRVIEVNGGVRERSRTDDLGIRRYWIELSGNAAHEAGAVDQRP